MSQERRRPESVTAARKRDHLRMSLREDVGFASLTTGLDEVRLRARALPESDLADVDLSRSLWGRRLSAPLMVSCMTGGTSEAGSVNRALATAAQRQGVAVGLGSGRVLLEEPGRTEGFLVRDVAPDVLLAANIGAAQLREHGLEACRRLVERCEADVLVVHLNAVQEAVQLEGSPAFAGVLDAIATLATGLDVPVIAKEVGFGMAPEDVRALAEVGVAGIDVAGAGGTNWARVEGHRDEEVAEVASAFADWGWPTATAVRQARATLDQFGAGEVELIGSGGLRHGVDALKVLCLGASMAALARGLLHAAAKGPAQADRALAVIKRQLAIAAWTCGARRLPDVSPDLLDKSDPS